MTEETDSEVDAVSDRAAAPSATEQGADAGHGEANRRVVAARIHSGPLPDPQVLDGYEQLAPGSARQIIQQWERQATHRQKLENRGQWFALVIALAAMATAVACAALDAPFVGGAVAVSAVLGISVTSAIRLAPHQKR